MGLRPIKASPVHDCAFRDCNQRADIVEHALQRFPGPSKGAPQRFDALGPLTFDAAMDA
jgi:hypothetical protein